MVGDVASKTHGWFYEDIMQTLSSFKVWMWSVAIVSGLTGSALAQHGHAGGGHAGGHHGGMSGGGVHHSGGTTHHHHSGGYSGGGYYGGGYGGYGYSGIRIGIGGFGYGSGYGGYPYGYGSGYGSGLGYGGSYYSAPRYYTTPTYAAPTYSYPSTVIINSTPAVAAPTFDNGPIVITAPAVNDKPVEYTLNGQAFSIKPGQSQKFNHDRDWIVGFDRGDGKGAAQYSLKASAYKFKMTANGWELFEAAKPEPPTDSAASSNEAPKPIDLIQPEEKTVPPKPAADAPAKAEEAPKPAQP